MSYLRISQVAKILKVNTRTLMRWDNEGKFVAHKEPLSKIRFYDEIDILNHEVWFELRRKHKAHLKNLDSIKKEVDRFVVTQPLEFGANPMFHKLEDMKKAYDALRDWEKEERKITSEYGKLPSGFKAKVDPET